MVDGMPAQAVVSTGRKARIGRRAAAASGSRAQGLGLFLYLVPFLVLVFLFSYLPLYGWIYAFFNYYPALGLAHS
ncbi:MAG: hypothetical protein FWD85_12925, partial [Microbacteriaceae bacterium]|nr:hypothetical protein [Microbacteriaceae bacterium]MCL2796192.1 hypothetical protein [Microbacteriaceae bacterium]